MKEFTNNLRVILDNSRLAKLIKRGILRIFPKSDKILTQILFRISSVAIHPINAFSKATYWSAFLLGFSFLIFVGCSTTRQMTTQLVRDTRIDTVYLSNTQYDSIYIYQDKLIDRTKDTIYVKDVSVEYRYKLLRDTIKVIQRDSIPYEITVIETKEITRPLTWFDHLTRSVFWIVAGLILFYLIRVIREIRVRK